MALYAGAALHPAALLWGQVAVTATQLMTHFANEYYDLAADRANPTPTRWSGGSRVLVAGLLPPETARRAACVCAIVALFAALILSLTIRPDAATPLLSSAAIFLSWEYNAPPLRLHSRGLGELTAALVVTGLTPLFGFHLQMGRLSWLPLLSVLPLCCLQFAMLLTIEFPDAIGDARVGKRTLVVRMGAESAARLHNAVLLAAYLSLPLLVQAGIPVTVAAALLIPLPLAIWQIWRMTQHDWAAPSHWNRLAFVSVALLVISILAQLLGYLRLLGR